MSKYARIIRDGAEVLEPMPLRPPPGRNDGRECTDADHATALEADDGTATAGLEYRELPDDREHTCVACRFCGAILAMPRRTT